MGLIICWLFGHDDEEWEIKTQYYDDGGWWDEVLSYHCKRCDRIRRT